MKAIKTVVAIAAAVIAVGKAVLEVAKVKK